MSQLMNKSNCLPFATGRNGVLNLCVGVDPSSETLAKWGLEDSPRGLKKFCDTILRVVIGEVEIVKPQVAFFERHGKIGFEVLEDFIASAREKGVIVIADAKRGDIDSTAKAYAQAWLTPGAPLEVDALTVVPFLGVGALKPFFDVAHEYGKYVFVVVRSSNPEGGELQGYGSPPLWKQVTLRIGEVASEYELNSIGFVAGATNIQELSAILEALPHSICLAPGLGTQGAKISDFKNVPPSARNRIIGSVSRSITNCGPDTDALIDAIRSFKSETAVDWSDE